MQLEAYFRRKGALKKSVLADRAGIGRPHMSHLIAGRRTASPGVAKRIVKATGGLVRLQDLPQKAERETTRVAKKKRA